MMDNALKAISRTDDTLTVGNYIVLFGGRDLEGIVPGTSKVFWTNPDGSRGEYFTPETDVSSPYTKAGTFMVDWQHGEGREILGVGPGKQRSRMSTASLYSACWICTTSMSSGSQN